MVSADINLKSVCVGPCSFLGRARVEGLPVASASAGLCEWPY